jgi:uncharacterized protein (TIGR00251 family)
VPTSAKPPASAVLDIRVIPRAPRSRVDGERGGAILVRLAAPPVEGAANAALVAFLADTLDLPRRSVTILSGARSRDKRVQITGISAAAARTALLR